MNWTVVLFAAAVIAQIIVAVLNRRARIDAPPSLKSELDTAILRNAASLETFRQEVLHRFAVLERDERSDGEKFEEWKRRLGEEVDRLHAKASAFGSSQVELLGRINLELERAKAEHARLDMRINMLADMIDRRIRSDGRAPDDDRRAPR